MANQDPAFNPRQNQPPQTSPNLLTRRGFLTALGLATAACAKTPFGLAPVPYTPAPNADAARRRERQQQAAEDLPRRAGRVMTTIKNIVGELGTDDLSHDGNIVSIGRTTTVDGTTLQVDAELFVRVGATLPADKSAWLDSGLLSPREVSFVNGEREGSVLVVHQEPLDPNSQLLEVRPLGNGQTEDLDQAIDQQLARAESILGQITE